MVSYTFEQLTCPRCTATVSADAQSCARCGQAVELTPDGRALRPVGTACPRCSRPVRPGEAFVHTAGSPAAGRCPHCGTPLADVAAVDEATVFEEQALSCAPYELESVARAAAVDGWTLVDTTVDGDSADRILAHLRRPARSVTTPRRATPTRASNKAPSGRRRRRRGPFVDTSPHAAGAAAAQALRRGRSRASGRLGGAVLWLLASAAATLTFVIVFATVFALRLTWRLSLLVGTVIVPGLVRAMAGGCRVACGAAGGRRRRRVVLYR